MDKTNFNLYAQLNSELDDFFNKKIRVNSSAHKKESGYEFSQWDTINTISYVGASKFLKGDRDSEEQEKIYLNSSVFRADVASKQIDIDVKDIQFIATTEQAEPGVVLARARFRQWARETGLSEDLNKMVEDLPHWGTLVARKKTDDYELVPLTMLRNEQDADSLNSASYVIIEHPMKVWEMAEMPDWDLSQMDYKWDEDCVVYERFGRVPETYLRPDGDETKAVDTVSFLVKDKKSKKKDAGIVLFIEEISERPFSEIHWKKLQGRWMGVGEIENNFDNQKARNAVFNMRMRSLLWNAKNIFQSTDEGVAKNLVKEVKDGQVLTISANGEITKVNMQNNALADYNAADTTLEGNSDQKSFTYEVATGEGMKANTPFRLGVLLSNSVNSHFGLKQEKLGLFVKDLVWEYVIDKFEDANSDEHFMKAIQGEDVYEELIDIITSTKVVEFVKKMLKSGKIPTQEDVEQYKQLIKEVKSFSINVIKDYYKNLEYKIDIVITGESFDIAKKMETLTALYQSMAKVGDPRSGAIIEKIAKLAGEKLPAQASPVAPSFANTPVGSPTNA